MALWGNALGGYKLQPRSANGKFAAKAGIRKSAMTAHKGRKKMNAKAHRARTKGSFKARGREFVTTAPKRSQRIAGGAAIYTMGRASGSARATSYGLSMAQEGVKGAAGRTRATYKMSKGLKKSRNRSSKDKYLSDIGSSRKKRNAMKIAAGVVAVGATAYAVKKGAIHAERGSNYAYVAAGRGVRGGAPGFAGAGVSRNRGSSVSGKAYVGSKSKAIDLSGALSKTDRIARKTRRKAAERGFVI